MFENIDIGIDNLPEVDKSSFSPLDKKYRIVLVVKAVIFSIILITVFSFFYYYKSDKLPYLVSLAMLVVLIVLVVSNLVIAIIGFKMKKYKLRLYDLIYKTGVLWRSETSVPFVRIQHSEVIQGPIERIFKLAKLKLYTAGGHSSDLSVPGLSLLKAEQLKDYITKRIQEEEE